MFSGIVEEMATVVAITHYKETIEVIVLRHWDFILRHIRGGFGKTCISH